ncbi:MAG TPA: hypothetical protein VN229_19740 [Terriglobales bacterium]|nr:hypothetical protein [Terriglobales bacterium]
MLNVALLTLASIELAKPLSSCSPPLGAESRFYPDEIPSVLLKTLAQYGPIAGQGEPFNDSDVLHPGLPQSGVIFIWSSGAHWVITLARGGFVPLSEVSVYTLINDHVVRREADQSTQRGMECEAARRLFGALP